MKYALLILSVLTAVAGETRISKISRAMEITDDESVRKRCSEMLSKEVERELAETRMRITAIKQEISGIKPDMIASKWEKRTFR